MVHNGNHWLTLRLIVGSRSPRDAIGSKVFVTAGGVRQRADVFSGGSYGSSSDQRVHFGLGAVSKVDSVQIRWPSGLMEQFENPPVDAIQTLNEGSGKPADPEPRKAVGAKP